MRLFVAVDLPYDVQAQIVAMLGTLRRSARIQWSKPANLHITTKFIGDWPESRLDDLKTELQFFHPTFPISVHGIGWFPNARNPRVFYAGVDGGNSLLELARLTDAAVATVGIPTETKRYSPHLTLARNREQTPLDSLQHAAAQFETAEFGCFECDRFWLYESRPAPEGTMYIKLAEFPLNRS